MHETDDNWVKQEELEDHHNVRQMYNFEVVGDTDGAEATTPTFSSHSLSLFLFLSLTHPSSLFILLSTLSFSPCHSLSVTLTHSLTHSLSLSLSLSLPLCFSVVPRPFPAFQWCTLKSLVHEITCMTPSPRNTKRQMVTLWSCPFWATDFERKVCLYIVKRSYCNRQYVLEPYLWPAMNGNINKTADIWPTPPHINLLSIPCLPSV